MLGLASLRRPDVPSCRQQSRRDAFLLEISEAWILGADSWAIVRLLKNKGLRMHGFDKTTFFPCLTRQFLGTSLHTSALPVLLGAGPTTLKEAACSGGIGDRIHTSWREGRFLRLATSWVSTSSHTLIFLSRLYETPEPPAVKG